MEVVSSILHCSDPFVLKYWRRNGLYSIIVPWVWWLPLPVLRQESAPSSSQSPNNPCLMWEWSRDAWRQSWLRSPRQHGWAGGKRCSLHPVLYRTGLKCKMGIWCSSLVLYPPQFKDTGLCSSLVGYSLPKGFANFTLKYVPTDCLCYSEPIK